MGLSIEEAAEVAIKCDALKECSQEITAIGDLWRDFAVEVARLYKNRNQAHRAAYEGLSPEALSDRSAREAFIKNLESGESLVVSD